MSAPPLSGLRVIDAATLAAGPLVATAAADEVAEARAIIADYRRAEADGRGAIGRNGQLVDAAMMRHAENVLRRAAPDS